MHADHCTIQFYGLFSFEFRLKKYQKTIHHNTENKRPIIQFRCRPALTPDSTCPVFITLILYNKFHSSIKRMIQTVHSKVFFITDQIERSSEFSSKIRSAENWRWIEPFIGPSSPSNGLRYCCFDKIIIPSQVLIIPSQVLQNAFRRFPS